MPDSLYAKAFAILGGQLALTWLITAIAVDTFRRRQRAAAAWIGGSRNTDGQLDLHLDWDSVRLFFWPLLALDAIVFLILFWHGIEHPQAGLVLFSIWSVITGIELAFALVAVDENLGLRVLALTALVTCAAGLIGTTSGIDFRSLEDLLRWALLLLIALVLIRILHSIPRWLQRLWAFVGAIVFAACLVFDFHRLSRMNGEAAAGTWANAMSLAIHIYLDIINLLLFLLDLASD